MMGVEGDEEFVGVGDPSVGDVGEEGLNLGLGDEPLADWCTGVDRLWRDVGWKYPNQGKPRGLDEVLVQVLLEPP